MSAFLGRSIAISDINRITPVRRVFGFVLVSLMQLSLMIKHVLTNTVTTGLTLASWTDVIYGHIVGSYHGVYNCLESSNNKK